MGYFNLKSGMLLYGACARLNVQQPSAQMANMVHGHSRSSTSLVEILGQSLLQLHLCDQAFWCFVGMA